MQSLRAIGPGRSITRLILVSVEFGVRKKSGRIRGGESYLSIGEQLGPLFSETRLIYWGRSYSLLSQYSYRALPRGLTRTV